VSPSGTHLLHSDALQIREPANSQIPNHTERVAAGRGHSRQSSATGEPVGWFHQASALPLAADEGSTRLSHRAICVIVEAIAGDGCSSCRLSRAR